MLNVFRDNLRHLKWVLLAVIVGLVAYLGYYFDFNAPVGGADAAWAARVDGETIPAERFYESARRMDSYYRQLLGDRYEQLRPQLNLGPAVASALVDQAVQIQEARRLGLEATVDEVARTIQNDPNFRDANGQFIGKDGYRQLVTRNWRGGVEDYERQVRNQITAQKWIDLATQSVDVTDAEVEQAYRARSDRTRIDYTVVASAGQKFDSAVSDAQIAAHYAAHASEYARGEARRIRFVLVERESVAAKVVVSDTDARAFYDANPDQFTRKEQRRARHILVRVAASATPEAKTAAREKAEAALARIRAGEDFGAVARQVSEDVGSAQQGGDLGFFEKGRMVPQFEQAAFATPVGELSPLVESPFGFHVIQVTEARSAGAQPFEETRDALLQQLRASRSQEMIQSEAERLRGLLTGPEALDGVATREGLTVIERVVARDDRIPELGASPQFMEAVFALPPGGISQPLPVARGVALVVAGETLPPANRALDEVKDRVRSDVLNARARTAARSAASAALARHRTLEDAAKALGVEVRSGTDATPKQTLAGTGGTSPELDAALFSATAAVGDVGVAPVPAGAVIYRVQQVERFDPATFAARRGEIRDEILGQRRSAYVQAMTEKLRGKHQIEVNNALVEQVGR